MNEKIKGRLNETHSLNNVDNIKHVMENMSVLIHQFVKRFLHLVIILLRMR